jgi:5-(carboxyamino)imidazole ribonucleotide mutase
VATVAVGKAGAKNAGYLAGQILATSDQALHEKIVVDRAENAEKVAAQNSRVQDSL